MTIIHVLVTTMYMYIITCVYTCISINYSTYYSALYPSLQYIQCVCHFTSTYSTSTYSSHYTLSSLQDNADRIIKGYMMENGSSDDEGEPSSPSAFPLRTNATPTNKVRHPNHSTLNTKLVPLRLHPLIRNDSPKVVRSPPPHPMCPLSDTRVPLPLGVVSPYLPVVSIPLVE